MNAAFFRFKIARIQIIALALLATTVAIKAQSDTIKYEISVSELVGTGKFAPFWLQSNRYDLNTPASAGINQMATISKEYGSQTKKIDYGFKLSGLYRLDKQKSSFYLHEYFVKGRYQFLDMYVGAREEIYGNQDSTLSLGGLLISKNARPMPKVFIGVEQFTTVPYTFGLLELKGGISHGWFMDNIYVRNLLLHHKYLYARVGGNFPVQLKYGIDHVAQWGGQVPDPLYGQQQNSWKNFFTIFFAGSGGLGGEEINALGNHIISQSIRLDARLQDCQIAAYWQNISEDGPIGFILNNRMNMADGLWGVSFRNNKLPYIQKIVYEFLNTTDQSGPFHDHDGIIYGGADDYFNNYVYQNGWNYYSRIIGTPFITSPIYNPDSHIIRTINNLVQVHHFGLEGAYNGYQYRALASFSKNYGIISTPFYIENTSLLIDVNKYFPQFYQLEVGCAVGADFGKLYGNSFGVLLSVKKRGDLFQY